ncbi:hypothetical protein A1QO_03980 [Vibrio genomosp. F10 str. ZF-129]|uniref:Uncharacterized protein n=1 Tax=Vibrio genomosp. F10 str. ZF-129 TaxID=1187848 RepID=A0A1E5BIP5_9VIBR|nr:hypothetical protein [Vibrio genomosp. F10]OEE37270.1 hypothetical protein A1QO_03980 [Vibrio genomosp. F10 str. ZF-129]
MIKSTCIEIDKSAIFGLKLLSERAEKRSHKQVYELILKLHTATNKTFISVEDIVEESKLAKSTISSAFTFLSKHSWTISCQATERTEAKARTKLIYFLPLEDIDESKQPAPSSNVVAKRRVESLGIAPNIDPLTNKDLESSRAILPYNQRFANLVSPGQSIKNEVTSIEYTNEGEAYTNRANSTIGIMNDFDCTVRDHLFTLTQIQLLKKTDEFIGKPPEGFRFTIRMIDILTIGDFHDSERVKLSESIDRIRHSIFSVHNVPNDQLNTVVTEKFSFLTYLKGISARITTIDESGHPYIAIAIAWDKQIIDYLTKSQWHHTISKKTSSLTPLFNRIYLRLRIVYFSKDSSFNDKLRLALFNNPNLTLIELVQNCWANSSRKEHVEITRDVLKELSLSKTKKLIKLQTEENNQTLIELDLLGFKINMVIPDFSVKRAAANQHSEIYITANQKNIIEDAGAKFNAKRNNKPQLKNSIAPLFIEERNTRLALPDHVMEIENKITLINSRSDYYIKFEIKSIGQEMIITRYHDYEEQMNIYNTIASATNCDYDSVNLYFDSKMTKIKPFKNLSVEEFNEALLITQLPKLKLINLLSDNLRSITKFKNSNWSNIPR